MASAVKAAPQGVQAGAPTLLLGMSAREWVVVALITAAGAAIRFHALGARSLWFDEGFGAGIALLPWPDFWGVCTGWAANMGLYYLLLKLWLMLAHSDAWTRALSAIFGIASIPALYWLARRMFGTPVAVAASALLAVNAFHVKYSQEARAYTLVTFLVIVSTALLLRALDRGSTRNWMAWAVVSAVAVCAHLYAVLVIASQLLWVIAFARPKEWGRAAAAARLFALVLVPFVIALLRGADVTLWLQPLSWTMTNETLQQLSGNAGVTLPILFLAALIGGLRLSRDQRKQFGLVALWAFAPIAVVIAASFFKPLLLARYLIVCVPAIVLAASAASLRLPRAVAGAWLALAIGFSGLGTYRYFQHDFLPRDDWRSATSYVLQHRAPKDLVVFYTIQGVLPFSYYEWQANPSVPRTAPPELASGSIAEMIQHTPLGAPRIWLVLNLYEGPNGPDPAVKFVRAWLRQRYRQIEEVPFEGIKVIRYDLAR